MSSNSTTRFSDRVEDYVKYRPHYPAAILSYLQDTYSFSSQWAVADIGSGTGISTEMFLENGNKVYAVEPNAEMRSKAEELLSGYLGFFSLNASAEATGVPPSAVDLIVAGQAFHWFDPVRTRPEFVRIARPGAVVALIWNERLVLSGFEQDYESFILRNAADYQTINHKNITDLQIGEFFHPQPFLLRSFDNEQLFDLEGLKGRLLSSSYIPKGGPGFMKMIRELEKLFARHRSGGKVRVGYETKVYTGVIRPREDAGAGVSGAEAGSGEAPGAEADGATGAAE
ncbi:MAG TPA: class I SAM-dependent methyltransferase [Puia sp.]|jgi:SAM-dependent methyltransferase|nr:class I SAM-dependent methyltransferase [Puia sp.]